MLILESSQFPLAQPTPPFTHYFCISLQAVCCEVGIERSYLCPKPPAPHQLQIPQAGGVLPSTWGKAHRWLFATDMKYQRSYKQFMASAPNRLNKENGWDDAGPQLSLSAMVWGTFAPVNLPGVYTLYLHRDVRPSFNKFTGSGGPQMVNQCRDHRFSASSLHMQNPSSGATGFVFEDSIWFWFWGQHPKLPAVCFREPPPPTVIYSFAKCITYVACKLAESLIQLRQHESL